MHEPKVCRQRIWPGASNGPDMETWRAALLLRPQDRRKSNEEQPGRHTGGRDRYPGLSPATCRERSEPRRAPWPTPFQRCRYGHPAGPALRCNAWAPCEKVNGPLSCQYKLVVFRLAGSGATVHFADQSSLLRRSSRRSYSVSADAAPAIAGIVDAIGLGLAGFSGNIVYHLLLTAEFNPLEGRPRSDSWARRSSVCWPKPRGSIGCGRF